MADSSAIDDQQLRGIFAEEAERYFDVVLPRFIDRYFRGRGYGFLYEMLHAHDHDKIHDLTKPAGPLPGRSAKKKARRVRENCPLVLREFGGDGYILGKFNHSEHFRQYSAVHYEQSSERSVEIFMDSFRAVPWSDEEHLRREMLKTIVHEYIHYFESFLIRSEQVLRGAEERDFDIRVYTLEQARWKDGRRVWTRGLLLGLVAATILVFAGNHGIRALFETGSIQPPARIGQKPISDARLTDNIQFAFIHGSDATLAKLLAGTSPSIDSRKGFGMALLESLQLDTTMQLVNPDLSQVSDITCWRRPLSIEKHVRYICMAWSPNRQSEMFYGRLSMHMYMEKAQR